MNRDRQAKWDSNNLVTICTKLPIHQVHDLDIAIASEGYQSRYAFLQDLIEQWEVKHYKAQRSKSNHHLI